MTGLAVASYLGRIGQADEERAPPTRARLLQANLQISALKSENRALSRQLSDAVHELERHKQQRRARPANLSVDDIVDAVAEFYDVTPLNIKAHYRVKESTWARQVACYIASEMLALPLDQIGAPIGSRDRTTVHHAIVLVRNRRLADPRVDQEIVQIIFELDRRAAQ